MNQNKNTLQIQTVLYYNEKSKIIRSIESLARAVEHSFKQGIFEKVILKYGDGSSIPVFSDEEIEKLQDNYRKYFDIIYVKFTDNLGSARGHNVLAEDSKEKYILIMNPDIIMAPDTISELYKPYEDDIYKVGMVEARQLPIEHPKAYNVKTGETSWASTACTLFPKKVFDEVGGFDYKTFFLYCDDVDFSWMVRLAKYKIIFQPSAVVFHDKKLSNTAEWETSEAEEYYSAEAGLLMAYKWSRNDLVRKILSYFENSDQDHLLKAARVFREKEKNGELPKQLDKAHVIGEFKNNNYGPMRFSL